MSLTYSWKIIKTKRKDLSIKIGGDIVNFNNAIINIEWEKQEPMKMAIVHL